MNSFDVNVGEKTYKLFYDRASVRKFESIGGNVSDLQDKIYTSADKLFYCGLGKFHPNISYSEAAEISDKAIEEFGVDEIYSALVEPFMEVFTEGGKSAKGKTFLVTPKKTA